MNLKLISANKDYLLLVDKESIETYPLIPYWDEAEKELKFPNKDYNERKSYRNPIIAHLPLNNAPVLEGVPLLPELPKQEDDVEFDLDAELTKFNTPSRYNSVLKRYDYTESDIKKLFDKANTKRWSDEDVWKVIEMARETWFTNSKIEFAYSKDAILQSLSPVKLPVGFEPEYDNVTYFDTEYQEEMERDKSQWKLKIINNVIQGRWV